MPPLDHEQLNRMLIELREGNADVLDEIYAVIGRRMFCLARGIVKSREDAEDVLQESFLKLARGARRYVAGTNAYALIMRIVRNTALDFLRRNKRAATEDLDEFFHLSDERYSPERREDALLLEAGLSTLTDAERRMIYYRYYLDLTVREIARATGMSKSAAARAVVHAEEKLKSYFARGTERGAQTL